MTRPVYSNSYNRKRTRIDGRTDNWATRAGVTAQHKDGAGNVIGGIGADGTRFGTKAMQEPYRPAANEVTTALTATGGPTIGQQIGATGGNLSTAPKSATPRLDAGVQTPRLDSNPAQPIRYNTPESRASEMQSAAKKSAMSGAFGIGAQQKAQNLQGRQDLFARMQAAGAGAISDEMKTEAAKLGVTMGGWQNAMSKLNPAPAGIAAQGNIPWRSAPGGTKPPVGVGAMAPQPNAKPGSNPAVPRVPQPLATAAKPWSSRSGKSQPTQPQPTFAQPATPPVVQSIGGTPPAPAMTIGGVPTRMQAPPSATEVATLRQANQKQDQARAGLQRITAPPPAATPAPALTPTAPPAAQPMSIAGAGATEITFPRAMKDRYRKEKAADPKTPLRSATLAVGSGIRAAWNDVAAGFRS